MNESIKVLFIVGSGRTGSTLLLNLLGDLDGFFAGGELRKVWGRLFHPTRRCTCGELFKYCEIWSVVQAKNFGLPHGVSPKQVMGWQRESVRIRYMKRLLRFEPGRATGSGALDRYLEASSTFFATLADVTKARVIVDSSKHSGDAAALRLTPGIEPYFLHLVRDPRAVAYSWMRTKQAPDRDAEMPKRNPARAAVGWVIVNRQSEAVVAESVGRSIRIRYEDLVARPRESLSDVVRLVGEDGSALPLVDDHTAELTGKHIMGGNPNRFTVGRIELREDDKWIKGLGGVNQALVTAITSPMLRRYGYPLRPGPALPLA